MLSIPFGSIDSDLDSTLYIKDYDDCNEKLLRNTPVPIHNVINVLHKPKRIFLNVGGVKHEILLNKLLLRDAPISRLSKLIDAKSNEEILELCDDYDDNEFYFDRNNTYFETILNYYRTKHLHSLDHTCVLAFKEELKYWQIDETLLDQCCYSKYMSKKYQIENEIYKDKMSIDKINGIQQKLSEFKTSSHTLREKIWNLTENPNTSVAARVS